MYGKIESSILAIERTNSGHGFEMGPATGECDGFGNDSAENFTCRTILRVRRLWIEIGHCIIYQGIWCGAGHVSRIDLCS